MFQSLPQISSQIAELLVPFHVALALLIALVVDRVLGEPPLRWHPVVWMGNFLQVTGQRLPQRWDGLPDFKAFWAGALVWCAGSAVVIALAWGVQTTAAALPWPLAALLTGLALKPLLAWRMLHDEVRAVEAALGESLAAGRARLGWLVSRDVSALSEAEVRESAIESLAENLNDSVVAPIFWFVLLGLPGAALYRFANTADAMWGYRGERQGRVWEWAGKWAAWADDGLSCVPARLTAWALMVSGSVSRSTSGAVRGAVLEGGGAKCLARWSVLPVQARLTPSPNSGWPMAAMALVLGVRLGKPGVYTLNALGETLQAAHMTPAHIYARNAVVVLVFGWFVAIVSVANI